jgi:solute carrier family 25 protein 33/36
VVVFLYRALYFVAYSQAKQILNGVFRHESAPVHLCSAVAAGECLSVHVELALSFTLVPGLVTTTCTSPLWVIKTQMQLDPGRRLRANMCIRQIYSLDGLRGFYRGLSASYAGEYSCPWTLYVASCGCV